VEGGRDATAAVAEKYYDLSYYRMALAKIK